MDSGELFRRQVSAYNLVLMLFTWGSGKANEGVLAPKFLHKFLEGPPTTNADRDRELIKEAATRVGATGKISAAAAGSAFPILIDGHHCNLPF